MSAELISFKIATGWLTKLAAAYAKINKAQREEIATITKRLIVFPDGQIPSVFFNDQY